MKNDENEKEGSETMRVIVDTDSIKEIVKKHLIENYDLDKDLSEYISEDIREILIKNEDD
jgi:hypothetical protein